MNDNLNVLVTEEDGRWDDQVWLTEQANISAMDHSVDVGTEVG